jgi:hypothetical protein
MRRLRAARLRHDRSTIGSAEKASQILAQGQLQRESWLAGAAMAAITCGTRSAGVGFSSATRATLEVASGCGFHSFACLRRWLHRLATSRVRDPGPAWVLAPWQEWLNAGWRDTGDHSERFPAHGAHFGRLGGA